MSAIRIHSLVQPALTVRDLPEAVDRVHALLAAVPSEQNAWGNAVYAFGNTTFLELLGPVNESHTRWRFLRDFGPGLYMFCVDLANGDRREVDDELARLGKRVVAPGRETANITAGWHIHPRDACNLLMLFALKRDPTDNTDWAGPKCRDYVPGNTRFASQVAGVLARTTDPAGEARCFGELGFGMAPLTDGACGWRGPTGTIVELWPADAWAGNRVERRRDYALCLRASATDRLIDRLTACGLAGEQGRAGGRWLSSIDPILGVRFAVAPERR